MKKIMILLIVLVLALPMVSIGESATGTLQEIYAQAELLMVQGDYVGAAAKFDAMGAYSDASQMAMYCKAIAAAETFGLYPMAVDAFNNLGDFKDSKQMAVYYTGRGYEAAGKIDIAAASDAELGMALQMYNEAVEIYSGLMFFKDSMSRMSICTTNAEEIKGEQKKRATDAAETVYQKAVALEQNGEYNEAIAVYSTIKNYKDSTKRIEACQNAISELIYQEALAFEQSKEYNQAIDLYESIRTYRDSAERITVCKNGIKEAIYQIALELEQNGKYDEAIIQYQSILTYRDSAKRITACENGIKEAIYQIALELEQNGKYDEAIIQYQSILTYRDSAERIGFCQNEGTYQTAESYFNAKEWEKAYTEYLKISGYKDADAKCKAASKMFFTVTGYIVTYGHYEQDNDTSNGKEAIEWIVLDYDSTTNRSLLISRYSLSGYPYQWGDSKTPYPTWDKSDIRRWLNNEFIGDAFSSEEQDNIVKVRISTPDYNGNSGGADTEDKIWLLSRDEATTYFKNDDDRKASLTDYAKAKCNYDNFTEFDGCWFWWLRSPGSGSVNASSIRPFGDIYDADWVFNHRESVRPVLWLALDSVDVY